jgi:hypothetical protein
VRRGLPSAPPGQMVAPFIFFGQIAPAEFLLAATA